MDSGPIISGWLASALDTPGCDLLVIDVADLTFIDSSGVAHLIQVHRQARSRGVAVTVANPRPMVRRVLHLVGVAAVLGVEPEAS